MFVNMIFLFITLFKSYRSRVPEFKSNSVRLIFDFFYVLYRIGFKYSCKWSNSCVIVNGLFQNLIYPPPLVWLRTSLNFRGESLVLVEKKIANTRIAQLKIKEERNLGSLTCHILRDSLKPISNYFSANASTRFSNAGTYDPYRYFNSMCFIILVPYIF